MSLFSDISVEVHENISSGVHPTVSALVNAFNDYLKEPRYQNPLTLTELSGLFSAFYADLNSLVVFIYTQSNTNKRSLLANSNLFSNDTTHYDYLNALANYSPSSIKSVRRTDPHALFQLRIFAYYKFMTIMDSIEKAQYDLFSLTSSADKSTLYDKVFRFDERDIRAQELWSKKVHSLRQLNLPISSFCESSDGEENTKLDEFFLTLDPETDPNLQSIKKSFKLLNVVRTPSTKLKYLVKTQKSLLKLLTHFYEDPAKVNNDILLPAFIYIVIYHLPEDETEDGGDSSHSYDLYLNLVFIKSFLNTIDPQNVDTSLFTLNSSFAAYNPNEKKRTLSRSSKKHVSKNLFELINLDFKASASVEVETSDDPFFNTEGLRSDKELIDYLQGNYLNNGELQYYLTNYEAILHFLSNSTLDEIVPTGFSIPDSFRVDDLMTKPLHKILEEQSQSFEQPPSNDVDKLLKEELDEGRSRSNSFMNTISDAVNSVNSNRSRSNSAAHFKSSKEPGEGEDFESSIYATPFGSRGKNEQSSLGRVRNILGRLGSVSNIQFTQGPFDDEMNNNGDNASDVISSDSRSKRANTFFDRLSPNPTRTQSGSVDLSQLSVAPNRSRKSTLTKFSSGVSEFMNKLSTAAATNGVPQSSGEQSQAEELSSGRQIAHASNPSLHSLEEQSPFEDGQRRPEIGERTSSLHTMDKWFKNLATDEHRDEPSDIHADHHATSSNASNAMSNNGESVFSTPAQELTKFHNQDFDSLTINELKTLKHYYDQLCAEVMSSKNGSKTSNEYLPDETKDHTGI